MTLRSDGLRAATVATALTVPGSAGLGAGGRRVRRATGAQRQPRSAAPAGDGAAAGARRRLRRPGHVPRPATTTQNYKGTAHALVSNPRTPAATHGCESCHGPARRTSTAAATRRKIVQPQDADAAARQRDVRDVPRPRPSTRSGRAASTISATSAASPATACTRRRARSSSRPRPSRSSAPPATRTSSNKLNRFNHMPVREGKMECSSCHNPHGSTNVKLLKVGHDGRRGVHELPRGEARPVSLGARAGGQRLRDLPRSARVEQRAHARGQGAVPLPALPRDVAASSNGLRRLRAEQLDERATRSSAGRARSATSRFTARTHPSGKSVPAVGEEDCNAHQTDDLRQRRCCWPPRNLARRTAAACDPGRPRRRDCHGHHRLRRADRRRRPATRRGTSATATCGPGVVLDDRLRQEHRPVACSTSRPRTSATATSGTPATTRTASRRSSALFDSIPLNYSYLTSTPWVAGLDRRLHARRCRATGGAEQGPRRRRHAADRRATCRRRRSIAGWRKPFDLQSRRDTAGGGATRTA